MGVALVSTPEGRAILCKHRREARIGLRHFEEIVGVELEQVGKLRRRSMCERFDQALDDSSESQTSHVRSRARDSSISKIRNTSNAISIVPRVQRLRDPLQNHDGRTLGWVNAPLLSD